MCDGYVYMYDVWKEKEKEKKKPISFMYNTYRTKSKKNKGDLKTLIIHKKKTRNLYTY